MNLHYALFQMMRHDLCMQHEKATTRSLEFIKRHRGRHQNLGAYLALIEATAHEIKQAREI
jgi:hypothetical protein